MEAEGPKNYYIIRMQMVHVRKGRIKFNEKTRETYSFINTETEVRKTWEKIGQIFDQSGTVKFRKPQK